eukprot:1162101-Pelagomonas_calceolata.AAC.7
MKRTGTRTEISSHCSMLVIGDVPWWSRCECSCVLGRASDASALNVTFHSLGPATCACRSIWRSGSSS